MNKLKSCSIKLGFVQWNKNLCCLTESSWFVNKGASIYSEFGASTKVWIGGVNWLQDVSKSPVCIIKHE